MQTAVEEMKFGVIWKKLQSALEVAELVLLDALVVRGRDAVPGLDHLIASGGRPIAARIPRPDVVQEQSRRTPVLGCVLKSQPATIVEVHHDSLRSRRWLLWWRFDLKR